MSHFSTGFRFENPFNGGSDGFFISMIFIQINQKIRFYKNLIIKAINIAVSVMVSDEIADTVNDSFGISTTVIQHLAGSRRSFLFLQSPG